MNVRAKLASDRDVLIKEATTLSEATEFTDELEKRSKEIVASIKSIDEKLTSLKTMDEVRSTLPPNAIVQDKEVAVTPVHNVRLKNIVGPHAMERAYALGMYFRAIIFKDQRAQQYCINHGVEDGIKYQKLSKEERVGLENQNIYGGYLVPEAFEKEIIDLREKYGVIRSNAKVVSMISDVSNRPKRHDGLTAYPIGEDVAITESTKTWENVQLVAKKWGVLTRITNELNDDAIISVADDLAGEISQAFALAEDNAGFLGDGTSTYHHCTGLVPGIAANDGAYHTGTGGSGAAWTGFVLGDFNGVVGLLPEYAETPGCSWYCSKVFWSTVMDRLSRAAGGETHEMIEGTSQKMFLGYPVVISQVMRKTAANSVICALFGDMALAASFGDRKGVMIATSEHAVIGGVSVFERDEIAVRGIERFDFVAHSIGDATNAGPMVGLKSAGS